MYPVTRFGVCELITFINFIISNEDESCNGREEGKEKEKGITDIL